MEICPNFDNLPKKFLAEMEFYKIDFWSIERGRNLTRRGELGSLGMKLAPQG
jgi:hypothetical protein